MKRVLQLTFHCPANYGAILQTYALGTVMSRLGCSVRLLNLRPDWMAPVWPGMSPGSWLLRMKFLWFTQKFLPQMTPALRHSSELANECAGIDAVVVGSDQVWNPEITRHFADDYFLRFVPSSVRRISYAASFGIDPTDWLARYDARHFGEFLERFHSISVRETIGLELLRNINPEFKAQVVLDPTLLLSEEEYGKNLKLRKKRFGIVSFRFYPEGGYLSNLKKFEKLVEEKTLLLGSRKKNDFNTIYSPSPKTWVETIAGASFVITDSFHATCFAIIFKKEFIVLPANKKRIGRIKCLLDQLGIGNRLLLSEDDILTTFQRLGKINYDEVNERIKELNRLSIDYLAAALS